MQNKNEMIKVEKTETVKSLFGSDEVKKRFNEVLGKKAPAFISSMMSLVNQNKLLSQAEPQSILQAAGIAATLDLPINPSLGFAYIIPYMNSSTGEILAQFQLGYKGFIQLAIRTGQYKTINAVEVYEGEIRGKNKFTEEYIFGEKISSKIVGYMAYIKLINGFEKYQYSTVEEILKHAKKYSKSFSKGTGLWKDEFDLMAKKTVLKLLLSKYGIMSVELRTAIESDQAVFSKTGLTYQDNPKYTEKREIKEPEAIDDTKEEPTKPETEKSESEEAKEEKNEKPKLKKPEDINSGTIEGYISHRYEPKGNSNYFTYTLEEYPDIYLATNNEDIINKMDFFKAEGIAVRIGFYVHITEKNGKNYTNRYINSVESIDGLE